jgi:hypothetical protein
MHRWHHVPEVHLEVVLNVSPPHERWTAQSTPWRAHSRGGKVACPLPRVQGGDDFWMPKQITARLQSRLSNVTGLGWSWQRSGGERLLSCFGASMAG